MPNVQNWNSEKMMREMQNNINQAGGLFYQYRACRRNESTIYDIENIRHGVAYAQTPLNMNDPFDSMIGFSPELFYDECISCILDAVSVNDNIYKQIITQLLKNRAIGKTAEFMRNLNNLKNYIKQRQLIMHQVHIGIKTFVQRNMKTLFSKSPKEIKTYFPEATFEAFALIVSQIETTYISEKDLCSLLSLDSMLDNLYQTIIGVRDTKYIPHIRQLLETLTISCFSHSGWKNQLMWSHYANAYSGICIEYDFSQIKGFVGFVYPIKYNDLRPTLSLADVGIRVYSDNGQLKIDTNKDVDVSKMFSYLLVKNACWSYEDEWRIINIGEPNTPAFIPLPIKSITFGLHVDNMCRLLLWDVCKEKGIDCYQLLTKTDSYGLERRKLNENDFIYDEDIESQYIELLVQQLNESGSKVESFSQSFADAEKVKTKDWVNLPIILEGMIDMLTNAYFLKMSINRLSQNTNSDFESADEMQNAINNLKNIDEYVSMAKDGACSFQEILPVLFQNSYLDKQILRKTHRYLQEIIDLSNKCDAILWDEKINPNRLKKADDEPEKK